MGVDRLRRAGGTFWNVIGVLGWRKSLNEWWPETGSNRRRRPFQGRALPLSYLANSRMGARWVALHSSVGMPFHLPLSLRGGARCVLGRISERDNCVSIPSARTLHSAFLAHQCSVTC